MDCVFCNIVSGKLPCFKTYEDADFFGFLDIRPITKGNSLLVSKKHYRWVTDVPNFGSYWEAAKKLALATQSVVESETVTFLTLGFEVPHAHIRVIPRFPNDGQVFGIDVQKTISMPQEEMKSLAAKILRKTYIG